MPGISKKHFVLAFLQKIPYLRPLSIMLSSKNDHSFILSREVRKLFLSYFKERRHALVPSSSLLPHEDPSLLFVNAGMNQFKDVFLGKSERDYMCATSSQKCVRAGGKHNDLENVGHTSHHITFFEMLGNFSFGGYFKKEAIAYAWEVATQIFQFAQERIWVSVFETDEETFELWRPYVKEGQIIRLGEKENFWSMGESGPCGPCSELLYDRGDRFSPANHPLKDKSGERFLEFWNLVFMQYDRDHSGHTVPLPKPCIDTGAGLERIILCMSDASNIFQTDILRSLITKIEELSGKKYHPNDPHLTPSFHVIADHLRTLAFAIADGVLPSNTDRGYVLRKILRRALRYGRMLGFERPFLANLLPQLLEVMGADYQELMLAKGCISEILTAEEEGFLRTLKRGENVLDTITKRAANSALKEIPGEEAFKLKDTYGFPLEEILLAAKDRGLIVNLDAYHLLERRARDRSRKARENDPSLEGKMPLFGEWAERDGTCTFVGYDEAQVESLIQGIIIDGRHVDSMKSGQEGFISLNSTPFYAEGGGQVGDQGTLFHANAHFVVQDCLAPRPGMIVHRGILKEGSLKLGESITAKVDTKRRIATSKHHTATHLLHYTLTQRLGAHVRQAGSLVGPTRLRFDFNHHKALTSEEVREVEAYVNGKIWENSALTTYQLPIEEVRKHPEIKQFFSEKYEKMVRVVDIGGYSKELCGGTHVKRVGEIGYFRIAREESISKGVRRIEGVIEERADALRYREEDLLQSIATLLNTDISKVKTSISTLIKENMVLKHEVLTIRKQHLHNVTSTLLGNVKKIAEIPLIHALVEVERSELLKIAKNLMKQLQTGVILLSLIAGKRCHLLLAISPDLVAQGLHADKIIQPMAEIIKGSGGGKKELAQAGGTYPQGIETTFQKIEEILRKREKSR